MLPGFTPSHLALGGRRGIRLTQIGKVEDTTDTATYTFNAVPIGPATPDRIVVVGIVAGNSSNSGRAFVSATINGAAANELVKVIAGSGSSHDSALVALKVPTGTTATIVVTFSGSMNRCALNVWSLTGKNILATVDTKTAITTQSRAANLNVPPGGAWVAAAGSDHAALATSLWVPDKEDVDANWAAPETAGATYTFAHDDLAAGNVALPISVAASLAVSSSRASLAMASFGIDPIPGPPSNIQTDAQTQPASPATYKFLPGVTAGHLLIICAWARNSQANWTAPVGLGVWTTLYDDVMNAAFSIFYKKAEGNESDVTFTMSGANTRNCCMMAEIADWDGTTPPQVVALDSSGINPNPPAITPGWGAAETTYVAIGGSQQSTAHITAAPAGYDHFKEAMPAGSDPSMAIATKGPIPGALEDPGTFACSASGTWVAATIAVKKA